MNENTQILNGSSEENKPSGANSKKENKNSGVKTAAAVAGGVVIGNLAWGLAREAKVAANEYIENNEVEEEVVAEEIEDIESIPGGGIEAAEVSTMVTDDMSFNEAFASAREELGAGGIFEWNGNTYGTYYKEEWENLSPEETEEYWASVEAAEIDVEQEVMPEEIMSDELYAETADLDGDGYEESILADTDNDGDIDMVVADTNLDGEYDYVVADTTNDGQIDTEMNLENGEVVAQESGYQSERVDTDGDGYAESVLIDSNLDGNIDTVAADTNMDGELDVVVSDTNHDGVPDEVSADTNGDGQMDITETLENEDLLADNTGLEDENFGSDFDNDADMSEWA